jgi:hypothetical protein
MISGKWVGARIADTENSFCVGWIPDDLDETTSELIRVDSKRDAQVLATVLNSFDAEPITGRMSGMPTDELTVEELENSGYNEAAQRVLDGDMMGACLAVLATARESSYEDSEDTRVRTKAARVMGRVGV